MTMVGIVCVLGSDTAKTEALLKTLRHRGSIITVTSTAFVHNRDSNAITIGICSQNNATDFLREQPRMAVVDSLFRIDNEQLNALIEDLTSESQDDIWASAAAFQFGTVVLVLDNDRLLCWRSPDGQRPLYVGSSGQSTILATEKKALWIAHSDDVKPVVPGEVLAIDMESISRHGMMRYSATRFTGTEEQALNMLETSLRQAIEYLVDTRCGVLFSGGVDSSLIAHIASKSVDDITLFSASTKSSRDHDHGPTAAEAIGVPLVEVDMTEDLFWEHLPEVMYAIETTNRMDVEIAFPFFLASQAAKKRGVDLMVSGQGPDELFAGYAKHVKLFEEKGEAEVEAELRREVAVTHESNISRDERVIAMTGLSTCFPYLYPRFAEVALTLPASWKLNPGKHPERKVIFRSLAARFGLDAKLIYEPKKATQYSSGASRLLTKAIAKNVHYCRNMSQREVDMVSQDVLAEIGARLGIPARKHISIDFGVNLRPTASFLKSRGF